MSGQARETLLADIEARVAVAAEPFLVPDVTPAGESYSAVFHVLRDMVDVGTLTHGSDGYRRPE